MLRIRPIISLVLLGLLFASCTTSRWVVKEERAVDSSDYEVLEQHEFLVTADSLSPSNPVLELNLKAHTVRRFKQKVLAQRTIQDYRLRPGFLLLGLAGGAAAFYAGNSGRAGGGTGQTITFNSLGLLLAASGFVNLKPEGPPRSVQEERYIGTTGDIVKTDTLNVESSEADSAQILVTYRGKTVFEDSPDKLVGGKLNIPLGRSLADLNLSGKDPGQFEVSVQFNDSTYRYRYPVSDVLVPYAQTTAEFTSLRSGPEVNPNNVLADLTEGSRIRIDRFRDEWFEVRYGNFKNYIAADEAGIIWQSAAVSAGNSVVALPRIPFGNIDVEANIPQLREQAPNARALILTNENYDPEFADRRYAHRDGNLMESYLTRALGYPPDHIYRLTDIQREEQVEQVVQKLKAASNKDTELFVFISGYGSMKEGVPELIGATDEEAGDRSFISLRSLFSSLASVPAEKTLLVGDIDFSRSVPPDFTAAEGQELMEETAGLLTRNSNAAVVMGSRPVQPSHVYSSERYDNKLHYIFPYFFARALQQRKMELSQIYDLLRRNISYTSRRLHDRGQEPVIYGNRSLSFARE